MTRVLHLLSQRPSLTGSGVTLEAFVRHAKDTGWSQRASIGVPGDEPIPGVGGLDADRIHPLRFEHGGLDFPVPGMSDVMPYRSTRFSSMTTEQLSTYRDAWRTHIGAVARGWAPALVHSHHVWLMSAGLRDHVAPDVPIVTQCHATGLRQLDLCPHLAQEVIQGCERNDHFLVLHQGHAAQLRRTLSLSEERVSVIGAGYNESLFHAQGRADTGAGSLLYAGKYSRAKGLPQLLDAFEGLRRARPGLTLNIAGTGSGAEADALAARMRTMDGVVLWGQVDQARLAELMRQAAVFVLPSFYEGLPLVLVEALACGCRLVCTDLPGVRSGLLPHLDPVLERVPMPSLVGVDVPDPAALPAFVQGLTDAMERALSAPPVGDPAHTMPAVLSPFTWRAVFARVEAIWRRLIAGRPPAIANKGTL